MRNRIFKSMLATLMVTTLMVGTLTGCGQTETTDTTEATTEEAVATGETVAADGNDTFIADRTITIQVYVDDIGYSLPEDINNTPVMQELTKRTGIKLDIQYTPGDSDSAVLSSQLAAGSIPDVIVTYLNDSTRPEFTLLLKAAKEGLLADTSSYFADSKVYSRYLEDGYLPNDAKNNITFRDDLDGAAYIMQLSIPAVDRSTEYNPQDAYLGGMYIQKSIAEALNVDPTQIKTQDDLYKLLVQIKEGGFKDDNGNAVYPLGPKYWGGNADSLEFITRGFDWGVSDGYNLDADGNVKHEVETEYAWEKVSFIRTLLAEDLINPEFFTMDSTRAEEVSKTHNSAIIADVHNYQDVIYESGEWLPLGPLEDISGSQATVVSGKKGYGAWAISSEAANPEEIFAFFDYLSTYEGQLLCQYGVEGLSYNMVDGYPQLTEEVLGKLNEGDKDWLINNVGAGFGGSGSVFFYYVLTNLDPTIDFGESRPGAGASDTYAASVKLAEDYPRTYKLVKGFDATAYLNADEMMDVKAQLSLLNYKETLVQAMFASSDDEAKAILDSFKTQIQSAGIADFEEYVKGIYTADKTAVNFYTE